MTVTGVVDIAQRVATLATRTPHGAGPEVTPIRVEDLEMAREILEPVLRHLGGTVIDVGRIADQGAAETAGTPGQEAAIAAALAHHSTTGPREVAFADDNNGRHRAFWASQLAAGETTPDPNLLLGLATATIDERLSQPGGVVVVLYDEARLEPIERETAWSYVTQVMSGRLAGKPDHFIVVVGAERPEDYHLRGDPSLRWSTDGDRVAERVRSSTNHQLTARLAAARDTHVVFFLAAGFTKSMGMPLGNKMRDYALRRLLPDRTALPDDQLAEAFYSVVGDQIQLLDFEEGRDVADLARELTFERVLREELRTFQPSPTLIELERLETEALAATPRGALRHLHTMLATGRQVIIITVNYDRLIEHNQSDHVEVFADDEAFSRCVDYLDAYLADNAHATKVPVLKLHGSFGGPQGSLIASIEQTLTGLTPDRAAALDRACRADGPHRVPFIYVGASMRDLDIGPHLGLAHFARQLDEHWVMPLPTATVTAFAQRHRLRPWRDAGMLATLEQRTITWTADEFFEDLAPVWAVVVTAVM